MDTVDIGRDLCGYSRGGRKSHGHYRDRWGGPWTPWGQVWELHATGLMWAPVGGHGTLLTLGVQCEVSWSHGVGMGLCGHPGRIV